MDSPVSPPPPAVPPPSPTGEDKTVAIVSYLTLIGFVVAVVLHSSKKTALGSYHLRQALGLMLAFFAIGFVCVIPILGWIVGFVGYVALLVFWVLGFMAAINGEMKPLPLIGEHFQKWFAGAFS